MTAGLLRRSDKEWLSSLEHIATLVRDEVGPLLGSEASRKEVGTTGAGGDRTLQIDQLAEDLVLGELRSLAASGQRFSVLSEEIGLVDLGAEYPRVIVDPIDGSPNAQRGLPMVGVMLSLLRGPSLSDVVLGTTVDMTSGERWSAVRGEGARYNGAPLHPMRLDGGNGIAVLGIHALPEDLPSAGRLLSAADTFRQFYCMSLSLAYTAAGGIDVFCSPRRARIFDLTAGLLLLREVGGVITDLDGTSIDHLAIDLDTRTTLLCSANPKLHRIAFELSHPVGKGSSAVLGG